MALKLSLEKVPLQILNCWKLKRKLVELPVVKWSLNQLQPDSYMNKNSRIRFENIRFCISQSNRSSPRINQSEVELKAYDYYKNREKHFKCEPCGVSFVKLTGLKQHRKSEVCHALVKFSNSRVLIGQVIIKMETNLKTFISL